MRFLKNKLYFLLLLPVFFVLHGFLRNNGLIRVGEALLLLGIYLLSALLITGICWVFYRQRLKSALLAFCIMGFNFFFGGVQDLLRRNWEGTFFARYTFILPLSLVFFLGIVIILKKNRTIPGRVPLFLNILLLLLIVIDAGGWIWKITLGKARQSKVMSDLPVCDTCRRPDVYFIILDEYSGNTALKEKFGFDNTPFETQLRKLGFQIVDGTRSNYNYTPFSLASMLNMQYLSLNMKTKGPGNLSYCYQKIRGSRVLHFFEEQGYQFYNYSIFDFDDQPSVIAGNFLPTRTKLISGQTFLSRVWGDILFNIGTGKWAFKPIQRKIVYAHLNNNEKLTRLTVNQAAERSSRPKFVYTHLMMPHYPYYFDSAGKALPFDSLLEGRQKNKTNYVGYLQYSNRKILDMAKKILEKSPAPPIIILAGDHGFRSFQDPADRKYCFMNLTALYLPSGKFGNFYGGMSGVNLFPALLNDAFGQGIRMQKDSTIYLWD